MVYRGLYHCPEGNERRNILLVLQEHDADNEVIEGETIARFKVMMKNFLKEPCDRSKKVIDDYVKELTEKGWSRRRIDAVISKATFGMKI